MSLANATAGPSIITVNETDYRVSPLTLRDMGFLEQWLKDECMREARRQAKEEDDPEIRSLLIHDGSMRAKEVDVALKLTDYLTNYKFASQFILRGLEHEHPELRVEDVDSLAVVEQIGQQFIDACLNWGSGESDDGTKTKP